jgi:uncharacterized protein (TIGR03437 family)
MPSRLLIAVVLLIGSLPARSATLSAPDQKAVRGQSVIASLAFSGEGQAVSGIQFDLTWDQPLDLKLVIGDGLRGSSKLLYTAAQGPRTLRCIIAGGIESLPEAEVLKAFLVIDPEAAPGIVSLRITNPVATDPDGNEVTLDPATVNVEIASAPAQFVTLPAAGILNSASLLPGPVSPGEIITLLGGLPSGEMTLAMNGLPAPVLYSGLNQVNAIVPFAIDLGAPATLEVRIGGRTASISVPVAAVAPGVFTLNATGSGPGAVLNADNSLNSADNPAARGSTVVLFGTGFGLFDPPTADGQIAGAIAPTKLEVTAIVGGRPAVVTYAGAAPGLVAGVVQVNIQIPVDADPSPNTPVVLQVGTASTPTGVTLAVY